MAKKGEGSKYYGFDSSGLEKAATVSTLIKLEITKLIWLSYRQQNIWIIHQMQKKL